MEVLIAEDDRALCRSLGRAVEKLGYSVRPVHDGAAALEAVKEQPPDLVLLDLLLPKVDGLGVVQKLRSVDRTREIPIIAMSGVYRGKSVARDLETAGVAVFLEKPFSARDLAGHLEQLLGKPEKEKPAEVERERGDLSTLSAPRVLWEPMRDRKSGLIHFQQGKRHKELLLERGVPRAVRSNLAKETLGRRLFDAGHIDERAYQEAQRRSRASGQPQGALLVKLGAIGQVQLDRALGEQARDKLLDLLSWIEGETWFVEGSGGSRRGSKVEGWTPVQVIIQGAGVIHPSVLDRELGPYHGSNVSPDAEALKGEELGGAAQALLQALRSEKRVSSLLRDHASTLYAMWLVGCVTFTEAAKGAGAASAPASGGSAAVAEELTQLKRKQRKQNHFEVLGLSTKATTSDSRKAFVELAKRYHPDKHGGASAELQALASEVFARISQAHEVLSNPEQLRNYLDQLSKGSSSKESKAAVTKILSAEQQFQKAEDLVKRRQYSDAIDALNWALKLDPQEGEFYALMGWARFLQSPEDASVRREAQEQIQKATSLAPNSPSGYYYLAKLHKACEEPARAERMFRKVMELRPNHVEASQELRLIEMRKSKSGSSKTLFGFGKKK